MFSDNVVIVLVYLYKYTLFNKIIQIKTLRLSHPQVAITLLLFAVFIS